MFHGHTHNDHFQVYYDETGTRCAAATATHQPRATNVGFISPSVTPYYWLNPGYRSLGAPLLLDSQVKLLGCPMHKFPL